MKTRIYCLLIMVLTALWSQGAVAAALVSITSGKQQEKITLNVPDASPRKIFTVTGPDRLVVDVPTISGRPDVSLPSSYRGQLIKAVRLGQFNPETSRFVFDLAAPAKVTAVRATSKSIIIEIAAGKAAASSAVTTEKPIKKSSASQKPLVIIDPGHGGVDPGTLGPSGLQEKNITLEYAKALKVRLLATGRYRVMLTRENDQFIILRQRIYFARKNKGDLFISLHADSAPEQDARGLSIYTLSERGSDQEAEALAARENKADVLAGVDLTDERKDVADILISLAQRETQNRSATLANALVKSLDDKIALLPNSHRFAAFAVLKAPDIPSVLIETGFLSHPGDAKLLRSKTYRDNVTKGITTGIDNYFRQARESEEQ